MATDPVCWPEWLPTPEQSGYSYELTDDTVYTEMEIGAVRRRMFSTDEIKAKCTVILEACESAYFDSFENCLLQQGTTWFWMPLFLGGKYDVYNVQFVGRPNIKQVRGLITYVEFVVRVGERKKGRAILPSASGIARWPDSLPILQDGYSYTIKDNSIKSQLSLSTQKRTVFLESDEATVQANILLSPKTAPIFEVWERDILAMGTKWFMVPLWVGGEIQEYKARFKKRPQMNGIRGVFTQVNLELDIMSRDMLNPTVANWLRYMSPSEIDNGALNWERVHNLMADHKITTVPSDVFIIYSKWVP